MTNKSAPPRMWRSSNDHDNKQRRRLVAMPTWRYALWRSWDLNRDGESVLFVGLNPSTADEIENDATIRRCIGFAKQWGYAGIYMLNLFAFRSTDPKALTTALDPVGPDNDGAFDLYSSRAALIIAAWGSVPPNRRRNLDWENRINRVLNTLRKPVYCLGQTADGRPRHPSRISYAVPRELYWEPSRRI